MVFQFAWEVSLITWLQNNVVNTPFITNICILFTYLGEPVTGVFIIGLLYWGFDKQFGKYVGLNMICSSVINPLIKNCFYRIRPYIANDSIKCLKAVDSSGDLFDSTIQGYSFPSGHTMATTSLFGSISLYLKKRKYYIITAILILCVGFSRISLGVHYPTDVLVAMLVGILVLGIFTLLRKKYSEDKIMIGSAILFLIGFLYCDSKDYYQIYGIYVGFVLACLFDEKYVHFKNTKIIVRTLIRTIIGGVIFFGVSTLIKLPFSHEFVYGNTFISYLFTTFRYLASSFIALGVYPMCFKYNILKFDETKD